MTVGNYVRNLSGPGPFAAPGTATRPSGPPLPPTPSRPVAGGGFALHEACGRRGRRLRWYGRQSADPLGEKSPKPTVLAEWVCVLTDVVSVVVRWSQLNPLLRAWAGLPRPALAG